MLLLYTIGFAIMLISIISAKGLETPKELGVYLIMAMFWPVTILVVYSLMIFSRNR